MLNRRNATEVLDRDFLEARCKILELAATLDRIDRRRRGTASTPIPAWASSARPLRPWTFRDRAAPRRSSGSFRWSTTPPGARRWRSPGPEQPN